jgi:hypothetical protein
MKLKRGSTSVRRLIFIADSSSTVGAGLANLAFDTSSLVAYYFAGDLSNEVAITLATATLGTWTSGGFVAVDNTNMPGWYEIGIPNAALDGGNECAIQLRGAANMVPVNVYIELDTVDYQTAAMGAVMPTTAGRTLDIDAAGAVELDSAVGTQITAIETFATRMTTGLVVDGAVYQFTANMLELGPSGGGGGDATLAKQTEILAAIQGSEVIQVASPNVSGNLVLTQGDDYDGVANPKASWTVATDYTSGWTVRLTIRSAADAVIYTNTGSVVSSTVVAVTIAAPTGLTMTGCPGQWQGKFDVELTHSSGKKKTIALGTCYINEDQTR